MAIRRLRSTQRKLANNPELERAYCEIRQEYIDLGHITEGPGKQLQERGYHRPHHAVHELDRLTTKVRVVFDGSAKTSTGICLNYGLKMGTTLGKNLLSLSIRLRLHTYIMTTDLKPMFRQFRIKHENRQYLEVLWSRSGKIMKTFMLDTVKFVLELSSCLSVRCLHQPADDDRQVSSTYLRCDSTIVLHWLQTPPHQLKIFEANRVSKIQAITNVDNWHHVRSQDNPADVLSRGLYPAEFKRATIWRSGPYWLSHKQSVWPIVEIPNINEENLNKRNQRTHLHAGIQATLYAIRRRYWFVDGKSAVRKVVRSCITCRRMSPPTIEYIMGDLPKARVTQSRPFSKVGIDYCGPFFIKEKKFRNQKRIKVYIAIFVCLIVKAVHLEVVSELTTEAFIAALKRFVARRGICTDIYTDNGTNFVGADRQLAELGALFNSPKHQQVLSAFLSRKNIQWHFIPAQAPNFGGLWEAAVKSFKHHFKRVVGNELFTFEELNTFVIEIESILNSRPITPISSDPNDLLVLTPGHFLIGDSLTSLPEQDYRDVPSNRLSAWQHIQRVKQDFWSRWHREYINELTVRHKWTKGRHEIQEGSIVLIKEDNLPPLHWAIGRVIKLYPGKDGITRVASVKTSNSILERSVKRLAPLLVSDSSDVND